MGIYNEGRTAAARIMNDAVAAGTDPIQALETSGLLLTERRLMELRFEALEQVVQMLEQTPAHHTLGQGRGNLAEDYRKALIEDLDEVISKGRQKWLT